MTLRLGDTAPDFEQDSTIGKIRFHEWIGDYLGGTVFASRRLHACMYN